MKRLLKRIAMLPVLLLVTAYAGPGHCQSLDVVGFNVESGDADPEYLSNKIGEMDGVEIWGLSEVQNLDWLRSFQEAAAEGENASFDGILGVTGGADKLAIIYNTDRLELIRHFELDHINVGGRVRAPLVAELKEKATGIRFYFMVNHLYRSKAERRHEQARMLNAWAHEQELPVIATGDYNFDWNLPDGATDHDPGYDHLTAGNVFRWVKPAELVKTQCSPRYDSVLDFIFVSGAANQWGGTSEILFREEVYCQDDDRRSDHRPVMASFAMAADEGQLKVRLLGRISEIEEDLDEIRTMIEGIE